MAVIRYGKFLIIVVFFTGIVFCAASALASEESTVGKDKFRLNVGAFLPAIDSELSITSKSLGSGTKIDLEGDLGFDADVSLFRLDGYWRFAPRHRLYFGYYGFDRDASKRLTDQIEIGDKLFDVGVSVSTNWAMDFFQVSYAYSFLQSEKWEIAGSLGLYYLDTAATLRGEGSISDGQGGWTAARQVTEEESIGLPVPIFGLAADYHITPKWCAKVRGSYFTLSIDEWSGHILEGSAALEYLFHKNFGIGTAYNYFDVEVDRDTTARISELDYMFQGVQIYGIWYF
jgi:hypothetical protein